jgi:hypothetical protein
MIIFELWKTLWLYRLIILYFYENCELGVNKSKNYEFGWRYALLTVEKKNWGIAKVKHCYTHSERTDRNSYSWCDESDYDFRRMWLHSSSCCILQTLLCICFNFQRVIFRTWIYGTSTEQHRDLRCSRNSLPVHGNGMLRNSRSHLAVQHQPPLELTRCWWAWTQW